jgi:hypothetical protein
MRVLFPSLAALLIMLVSGCTWVDADTCRPNTSGGFGGGGTIPVVAAVGATGAGDFSSPRGAEPLDYSSGTPNPCMASDDSSDNRSSDNRSSSSKGGNGSSSPWTQEELAAFKDMANADPLVVARHTATASFAAVTAANLIAAKKVDPSTLDATTLAQLIDSVTPDAISAALSWEQSVDPGVFMAGIFPKFECTQPPRNCPYMTRCSQYPGWACIVTGCGAGSCPTCPESLANLVVKGWCTYGCMNGKDVVGEAYMFQTFFGPLLNGPHCFPD